MPDTFLSCDWGTSRFRLRLVERATGRVLRGREREVGVRAFTGRPEAFAEYLAREAAALAPGSPAGDTPVWISGMASSSIGWRELPYSHLPFPLDGRGARVDDLGPLPGPAPHPAWLVSGIRAPDDVLRGEETEILGLLGAPGRDDRLRRDAVLLLPGTHSKHVRVRDGAVVGFHTFVTGELLELLRTRGILSHSVAGGPIEPLGPVATGLRRGVEAARKHGLAATLFRVRTNDILGRMGPDTNAGFLCGVLAGDEILASPYLWGGGPDGPPPILLAARGAVARCYAAALETLELATGLTVATDEEVDAAVPEGHRILLDRPG